MPNHSKQVVDDSYVPSAQGNFGVPSAGKYEFDFDTGMVKLRDQTAPKALAMMQVQKRDDGSFVATVPNLATGSFLMDPGWGGPVGGGYFDGDKMALWEQFDSVRDGKWEMRQSHRFYRNDPLVFRCIQFLAQIANADLTLSCENENFLDIVRNWADRAMPHSFRQAWFVEYFKTGMVASIKTLQPYVPRDWKSSKIPSTAENGNIEAPIPATGSHTEDEALEIIKTNEILERNRVNQERLNRALANYEQTTKMVQQGLWSPHRLPNVTEELAAAQYEWSKGQIPGAYTLLDPLLIDIEGPPHMPMLRLPFLRIDGGLVNAVNNPNVSTAGIIETLPSEFVMQIRAGRTKVWLSPNICSITYGDKAPYERYPIPMVRRAFDALELKAELTAMDKSTARTLKNRILLVKVGDKDFPELDSTKIDRVRAILNTPSRNLVLVWNHCIHMEWIEPKVDSLNDASKYNHANDEIRTVFGVHRVFSGTDTGTGIGNSAYNFQGVKELVEEAQKKFLEFLMNEIRMLRTSLNISADVKAEFDKMNMQDEVKFWAVLQQAVMNGLIDHQTALETLKFHFPTIETRMKKIKKLQKQGIFLPTPSANNLGPGGTPAKGGTKTGGKPANQPLADNNANKKGKPNPKGAKIAAKARIMSGPNGNVIVINDDNTAGNWDEVVKSVASLFSCDSSQVVRQSEYEKATGNKVYFVDPLPELDPGEMLEAALAATDIAAKIDTEYETLAEAAKSEPNGKVRGPYLTANRKAELRAKAESKVMSDILNGKVPDPDQSRIDNAMLTIAPLMERGMPTLDLKLKRAATISTVVKMYQKSKIPQPSGALPTA